MNRIVWSTPRAKARPGRQPLPERYQAIDERKERLTLLRAARKAGGVLEVRKRAR